MPSPYFRCVRGYLALSGGGQDTGALAEGVGFEPTVRQRRTPDFESGAFDHSATLPI